MALLDAKSFNVGRQSVYYTTSGVADLPSVNPNSVYQLGDVVVNLSGGMPALWVCTNAGSTPTWSPVGTGGLVTSNTLSAVTLTAGSQYVISSAGTITIPAAANLPTGQVIVINATASSVTITPASGSISGAASITLTANQNAAIISNGTLLYRVQ